MKVDELGQAAELWAQLESGRLYLASLEGRTGDIRLSPTSCIDAERLRQATRHHIEKVTFQLTQLGAITD
jgi:hypothetical protein